jgi:hypothetical protein
VSENIRKPLRAGIIAAVVAFSVIAGTVGSYAFWAATATATLGAGAATLSSTTTGWAATILGNEDVTSTGSASLSSTGSITFTNTTNTTSTQSQTLTATFSSASGDATLAAQTTLTAWYVASAASCTAAAVPVSPVSGTWSAGVVVTRSLAPGATATYCLRNTIADRQNVSDTDGARTFTPQAVAQLTISNFTNSATTTSAISTEYVFPLQAISAGYWYYIKRAGTEWCWDVSGGFAGSGAALISYACHNNAATNQDFRFMDADGDGYRDIQARHAPTIRVAAAASTTSGSLVNLLTANTTDPTQGWQAQLVGTGPNTYQFVNKYSGLCVSMPAVSAGAASQVTCNGGADQRFTLTQRAVIQLLSFVCTDVGGTGTNRSVSYTWSADYAAGPYTVRAKPSASGTWTTIGTTAGTTLAFASPVGAPFTSGTGTYNVQILNANGDQIGSDDITVSRYLGFGYYYARC